MVSQYFKQWRQCLVRRKAERDADPEADAISYAIFLNFSMKFELE